MMKKKTFGIKRKVKLAFSRWFWIVYYTFSCSPCQNDQRSFYPIRADFFSSFPSALQFFFLRSTYIAFCVSQKFRIQVFQLRNIKMVKMAAQIRKKENKNDRNIHYIRSSEKRALSLLCCCFLTILSTTLRSCWLWLWLWFAMLLLLLLPLRCQFLFLPIFFVIKNYYFFFQQIEINKAVAKFILASKSWANVTFNAILFFSSHLPTNNNT